MFIKLDVEAVAAVGIPSAVLPNFVLNFVHVVVLHGAPRNSEQRPHLRL